MKRILNITPILALAALLLPSCKETPIAEEFDNWQNVNEEYISNISAKCATFTENGVTRDNASEGEMFRLLSYLLDPKSDKHGMNDYVYCEVIAKGEGTESPHFTDSVWIDYRARLIPSLNYPDGKVIDQSFRSASIEDPNNNPVSFVTSKLVPGVSTALIHMKEGDVWRLYIPYTLAYGKSKSSTVPVPPYSTLVFEVSLEKFRLTRVD